MLSKTDTPPCTENIATWKLNNDILLVVCFDLSPFPYCFQVIRMNQVDSTSKEAPLTENIIHSKARSWKTNNDLLKYFHLLHTFLSYSGNNDLATAEATRNHVIIH